MPSNNLLKLLRRLFLFQDDNRKKQYSVFLKKNLSLNNRTLFIRIILYIVALIQVGLLYFWTVDSMLISILNFLLFSLVYAVSFPLIGRLMVPGLVDHIWATWIIGGIGMLLGHQLDTSNSHGAKHMHDYYGSTTSSYFSEILPFLLSGMTITMLIFCIPACLFLCNRCLQHYETAEKWGLHGGSIMFMLFGMLVAANSGPLFVSAGNGFDFVGYYFMLTIMVLFSSSAYYTISKIITNKALGSQGKSSL
jgi:hypothetical protein